ncbi:MAG: tetratricopeptide repeat protein [Deltaproteobacteria bacterium]|nr:tetratricopeptide repeat protein [Deltaproteobacteria bacterium]
MNSKTIQKGVLYLFFLFLSGCAAIVPAPQKHPQATTPETTIEKKELPEAKPRPREVASLHLTEQGQMLLERGKVDDAISVLERAVSIHASNGKNYYFLAEAWLKKGNFKQAREWNRLAEMYLAGDREWSQRVYDQRERLKVRTR